LPFRITGTAPLSASTRANCCIVCSTSACYQIAIETSDAYQPEQAAVSREKTIFFAEPR
jgi:hypothetical protein